MRWFLAGLAVCLMWPSSFAQERRLALLIGNQEYSDQVGDLASAHLDVMAVALALDDSGFETHTHLDVNRLDMMQAISQFRDELAAAKLEGSPVFGFVYFAGQGFSVADVMGERNLLVASHENVWSADDLLKQTVSLGDAVTLLEAAGPDALFIISDASRDGLKLGFDNPGRANGLVAMEASPGTLIAYSSPAGGRIADDGVFAKKLAREILEPNQLASVAIRNVLVEMSDAREDGVELFMALDRLPEHICFNECPTLLSRVPMPEVQPERTIASMVSDTLTKEDASTQAAGQAASGSAASSLGTSVAGLAGDAAIGGASGAAQAAIGAQMSAAQSAQTQATLTAASAAAGAATGVGATALDAGFDAFPGPGGGEKRTPANRSNKVKPARKADAPQHIDALADQPPAAAESVVGDGPMTDQLPEIPRIKGIATEPPRPAYPEQALALDIEGACDMSFGLSPAGIPFDITAACTDPVFEQESIRAVSRAKFEPQKVGGKAVMTDNMSYPLEFVMD